MFWWILYYSEVCSIAFWCIGNFFFLLKTMLYFKHRNYWGKSLAYSKLYSRLPHTPLCPYKVIPLPSGKHGSYLITWCRNTITNRQKFRSEIGSLKIFSFGIEEFNPFWRLINGCNLFSKWKVAANLTGRPAFLKVQHCYKLPFWSECMSFLK